MEISAEIVLDCRFSANTMAVCERGFTLESRMCWNSSHLGLQSHLMGFARNLYGQGRQHISAVYLSPLPCPLGAGGMANGMPGPESLGHCSLVELCGGTHGWRQKERVAGRVGRCVSWSGDPPAARAPGPAHTVKWCLAN